VLSVALLLGWLPNAHAEGEEAFKIYWKEGLRMETPDKQFQMKIGGRIHNDWVWWQGEEDIQDFLGASVDDGVEFRRARIYLSGEMYDHVIWKAEYDFAGGESQFKDVFMGLKDLGAVNTLRAGHFKEPFSLEELTSSNYTTFMERGLPNAFVPSRNTGIGINTGLADDLITVAAGVFRDSDDFGEGIGDNYQFSGRLTGLPLYVNDGEQLVHLGFSYRRQNPDGNDLQIRSRPEAHCCSDGGDLPRFVDTGVFDADDLDTYGFEGAALFGPFSAQAEYILADVGSDDTGDPLLSGWYVFGSWLITGEQRIYKKEDAAFAGVKPNHNFLQDGGMGAWELAARYSSIDLNDEGVAGGELDDVTLGVNWYLNHNARVMVNYIYADLDGISNAAHALMTRFQVNL
jgi:phosphate-selective porin OprO/OprP